jgi:hypothetical protein
MNPSNRRLIGFLSSLLAIAGLWRAAERFDPVTRSIAGEYAVLGYDPRPSESCAMPCTGPSCKVDDVA